MSTYTIGYGYTKTGMSLSEAADQLAATTREKFDKFLSEFDLNGVAFDSFMICSESIPGAIHDVAVSRKMDMIVLGSRGLTASAAAVIGSTTEDVISGAALPVLVVKKKGETVGLLNALLSQVTS